MSRENETHTKMRQLRSEVATLQQLLETYERIVVEQTDRLYAEIAERKKAEDAIAEHAQELARSNAELEQFAYVASHDLQEPLRMVASFVQLLERRYKGKLESDAEEFIAYAVEGATRMKKLVNDLLAVSMVGGLDREMRMLEADLVLTLVLRKMNQLIESTHAVITSDSLPPVVGNGTELGRLFEHLIDNAIKFRSEAAPRIHIGAEVADNDGLFSVCDNGIGIERAYYDKIFRLFQRLNRRDQYPGTGVGLAECKKIVERHGGKIWVESEPGKGSTFFFTIPRDRRKGSASLNDTAKRLPGPGDSGTGKEQDE
ncbi:MAG TPA: ATP-binding protein [Geobacteraceae bacterium]